MTLEGPIPGDVDLRLLAWPDSKTTRPLGRFRAAIPDPIAARITRHIDKHDLLAGDRGEMATAEGSGAIVLETGGHRAVLGLATAAAEAEPAPRPNLLLLVAEDLSPRIHAFGDPLAETPAIDRLAAEGVRFTNAFTTAGVDTVASATDWNARMRGMPFTGTPPPSAVRCASMPASRGRSGPRRAR